ncbi:MAG: ParB/RepB/Spo0J family partition protein [Candidatus Aureabacteria bacterium]|nr:ParB/RepB/Spo0J family partition protein [Candidatus Auribacterota bacterium]
MAKKALGKGLGAIIQHPAETSEQVVNIPVEKIKANVYQPRRKFDQKRFEELVDSIKEKGILNPITVRKAGDGYELIAGERRYRAAKQLNMDKIFAIVKIANNEESLELALIENLQREDLNPIEEADGYKKLMDSFGLTQELVAQKVGKNRASVANILRLLSLPLKLRKYLEDGSLTLGHAKVILGIKNPQRQLETGEKAVREGMSVRQLEVFINEKAQPGIAKVKISKESPSHIKDLENRLREALKTKVKIKDRKNKGRIEIEYYSLDELDRILEFFDVEK